VQTKVTAVVAMMAGIHVGTATRRAKVARGRRMIPYARARNEFNGRLLIR
jgi:hypothetical protein